MGLVAIRPHHINVLGYDLLVYHLDTGSSAWLDGTCIGRLSKVKDLYRTEAGELLPLQDALESLVSTHLKQSGVIERV